MTLAASNPTESARKHRISELDGMRAFSVALVIVYHSWLWAKTFYVPTEMGWLIDYVGLLGVKIFFVISGFIITRLMLEEVAETGRFSARVFFIKRVFRIIPAYWTYLTIMTLLAAFGVVASDTSNLLPSLFFMSDFLQWGNGFFYAHSWSLSVEEQFYLMFPLLVGVLVGKGARRTSIILGVIYFLVLFSPNVGKIVRVHFSAVDIGFLNHFRFIIAGVLLSVWWDSFGGIKRTNLLFPLAALVSLLGMVYLQDAFPGVAFFGKYFFMLVEPALITTLMGWILYHPAHFGVLRWSAVQWLGRISYSIYLWQQLFTGAPNLYLKVPQPTLPWAIVLILVCASLSYYLIERPFNAMGRRFIRKKKGPIVTDNRAVSAS